jgi:beta-lactamase regulating signal transducer with metallopeptidase domain
MIHALTDHLGQSTLFAIVAGLLTLLLQRNSAAVRHKLWLAASIKFLVPFSLLTTIGNQVQWRKATAEAQPQVPYMIQNISRRFALPGPVRPQEPAPGAPSRVPPVLFGLWLCGF